MKAFLFMDSNARQHLQMYIYICIDILDYTYLHKKWSALSMCRRPFHEAYAFHNVEVEKLKTNQLGICKDLSIDRNVRNRKCVALTYRGNPVCPWTYWPATKYIGNRTWHMCRWVSQIKGTPPSDHVSWSFAGEPCRICTMVSSSFPLQPMHWVNCRF